MIRDATPEDAAAIAAIWNPIIRETVITFWPTERGPAEIAGIIRSRQAAGHGFFVAEEDGRVLGFAGYTQFRAGLGYAHSMEHSINLSPDAKGRGLGRDLMARVETHAKSGGAKLMIGGITGTNEASVRFHAALGYTEWGRIPKAGYKFGQWHDLVLMGRDLWA